ncbi:MAG: hypothetical protein KKE02_23760 [Alphaproteobacteria bacterium]|nr:hypothetical protein [Alphaproteobacteria bacterium]MBU1514931.1 hypothetical protein [Alphaproteobacteria bacterium]MBU2094973.1 hypothetical protein [Alphaproteobacteria bacterium]MBU2154054.1 hypothetical protein [Alphaproteobacteria bacterium]MBU2305433.1 hypothetical protein [Alphaproteobacteria bacterium]
MDGSRVHFEVFIRKVPGAAWTLDLATENRATAMSSAQDLMAEGRVAAVKVTKEVFDEESREFQSIVIQKLGAAEVAPKSKPQADPQPLCVTPQDLYTIHARERIGRLLETWLERNNATPFELLHRPDLVEALEASGIDLQHAIQKIAIPEAHARAMSVHELIRVFHSLIERAVERLLKDHRKGVLPNLDKEKFASAAERLAQDPERSYLLGAGVAASIAPAKSWSEKVDRLLDLADAAPEKGPGRGLALSVIQQPLAEILEAKPGITDILGKGRDLGANLAAMTRLAAYDSVARLIKIEASVAKVMPELSPQATRLAQWLTGDNFQDTRAAIGRRILRELVGPRRLCPGEAAREIDVLRALAMSLTAAAGKLLPLEEVQSAFAARSKMLVTGDFVEAYLGSGMSSYEEVEALIWLTENIIGAANKRQAGGWLKAVVASLRFEKEMVTGDENAGARLGQLAALHKAVGRCGLVPEDFHPIQEKLGELGGQVESNARLSQTVARANAPLIQRLTLLLKLASGENAPLGPAANRARAEALKLFKQDDTRAELANSPDQMKQVLGLIQQSGLAA